MQLLILCFSTFGSRLEAQEQGKIALQTLRKFLGSSVIGALTEWMDVYLLRLLFGCISALLVAIFHSHPMWSWWSIRHEGRSLTSVVNRRAAYPWTQWLIQWWARDPKRDNQSPSVKFWNMMRLPIFWTQLGLAEASLFATQGLKQGQTEQRERREWQRPHDLISSPGSSCAWSHCAWISEIQDPMNCLFLWNIRVEFSVTCNWKELLIQLSSITIQLFSERTITRSSNVASKTNSSQGKTLYKAILCTQGTEL